MIRKNKKGKEAEVSVSLIHLRAVLNAFNRRQLARRCNSSKETLFREMSDVVGDVGDQYGFTDNGSRVLAVAHIDHVQKDRGWGTVRLGESELIFSPRLDDRLGVYTILDLLPKLGVKTDILLTDNEETGNSTAKLFSTKKRYNWMVEFDRKGTGAVTYSFDTDGEWDKRLRPYFGNISRGTVSDISYLDDMGCKAFNVGVGYHDEHALKAYMVVEEYIVQIAKFLTFYHDNKRVRYQHEKKVVNSKWGNATTCHGARKCDICNTTGYTSRAKASKYLRRACAHNTSAKCIPAMGKLVDVCYWCQHHMGIKKCWGCNSFVDEKQFRDSSSVTRCYGCSPKKKEEKKFLPLPDEHCDGCGEVIGQDEFAVYYLGTSLCGDCAHTIFESN